MQSTSELLTALSGQGITVSLVGGDKLKVEPRRLITDEVKGFIGQHKTEIIEALSTCAQKGGGHVEPVNGEVNTIPVSVHPPTVAEQSAPNSRGCFQCGHYDGIGAAWPGMCRFFETIGDSAKEIDFNVVDPLTGCKCFMARTLDGDSSKLSDPGADIVHPHIEAGLNSPQRGVFAHNGVNHSEPSKLRAPPADNPNLDGLTDSAKMTTPVIPPAGKEWLAANRQRLRQCSWTASQLYRKNKSPGLIFSPVWEKQFLEITILKSGSIEFEFIDGHKDCINVARPMPQRSKKLKHKVQS
jgi:hypothetical protein